MEANKEVQKIELNIFKVFKDICEKNNLRYFAIGGTLLGAVRHKGYIPWDDDIDVGMPRPDYDKFITEFEKELPEGMYISSHKTDPNWFFDLVQLVDKKIVVDVYFNDVPRRCHLWVDIFPIDGLPTNAFMRNLHVKHIMFTRYLIQLAHINTQVSNLGKRPFVEKLILSLFRLIPAGKLLSSEKLLSHLRKTLKLYPYDGSKYSGNMLGRNREKDVVPTQLFGTKRELIFENTTISCPEYPEEYLTHIYGSDFMQLPPVDKRDSHKVVIVEKR